RQQQFENDLATRKIDQIDQERHDALEEKRQAREDALAENVRLHDQQAADRTQKANDALNESIPAGRFIEDTDANKPLIGRLQVAGGLPMPPNQEERPAVDVGPLLLGDSGGALKRGYLKLPTARQQQAADTLAEKQDADRRAQVTLDRQQARDGEIVKHDRAM